MSLVLIVASASQFEVGKGYLFFFAISGLIILVMLIALIPSLFFDVSSSIFPVNDSSLYKKDLMVSRMAIRDGGLSGSGLGQGLYKLGPLETPHIEYIFATVYEETGLIGLFIILVPAIFIMVVGVRTANRARVKGSHSLSSIVIGGTILIVFSILLNILHTMGLNPFGGMILPFFSYDPISEGVLMFMSVVLYRIIYKEGRPKDELE